MFRIASMHSSDDQRFRRGCGEFTSQPFIIFLPFEWLFHCIFQIQTASSACPLLVYVCGCMLPAFAVCTVCFSAESLYLGHSFSSAATGRSCSCRISTSFDSFDLIDAERVSRIHDYRDFSQANQEVNL